MHTALSSAKIGTNGGDIFVEITALKAVFLYLGSEVVQAISGQAGLQELTHIAGGVVGTLLGFAFSRGE